MVFYLACLFILFLTASPLPSLDSISLSLSSYPALRRCSNLGTHVQNVGGSSTQIVSITHILQHGEHAHFRVSFMFESHTRNVMHQPSRIVISWASALNIAYSNSDAAQRPWIFVLAVAGCYTISKKGSERWYEMGQFTSCLLCVFASP